MIIVSACLAGVPCRFDGQAKGYEKIKELVKKEKTILVCPEQLGGLTTPRLPSEIKGDKVFSKAGTDVTAQFTRGAEITLALAKEYGSSRAILKSRSPSCGKGKVYDGTFSGQLVDGNGFTEKVPS
ncbi:MAG TPA: DUF523 domain-containing protein [Candidatus Rifleibacterium sp.]|nr:DUF523 domain-containing protein [Candidatus Rifleibacterium sp.]